MSNERKLIERPFEVKFMKFHGRLLDSSKNVEQSCGRRRSVKIAVR